MCWGPVLGSCAGRAPGAWLAAGCGSRRLPAASFEETRGLAVLLLAASASVWPPRAADPDVVLVRVFLLRSGWVSSCDGLIEPTDGRRRDVALGAGGHLDVSGYPVAFRFFLAHRTAGGALVTDPFMHVGEFLQDGEKQQDFWVL